jgi:hypothetical protein
MGGKAGVKAESLSAVHPGVAMTQKEWLKTAYDLDAA